MGQRPWLALFLALCGAAYFGGMHAHAHRRPSNKPAHPTRFSPSLEGEGLQRESALTQQAIHGGGGLAIFDASGVELEVATATAFAHLGVFAEPHKPTAFSFSLFKQNRNISEGWLLHAEGPKGQQIFGRQGNITFYEPGQQHLKVSACPISADSSEDCSTGASTATFLVPVRVNYVRRSILSLDKAELEKYFSAIKVMRNHTTEGGQAIFGPRFYSYMEMAALHTAAVWVKASECDFGHHGPAFVTFHRAFLRMFELSLQSIDPSLAMPYWDYLNEKDPLQSFFFSDDYYGNYTGDPLNDFQVVTGQFANWTVPSGTEALALSKLTWGRLGPSNTTNAYGFFRGPDNVNKAPFITRYGTRSSPIPPNITTWETCAQKNVFGDYIHCLDTSNTHPFYHACIGGSYGVPKFEEVVGELNCSAFATLDDCKTAFTSAVAAGGSYRSQGVREGCIVCDKRCTLDQPLQDCGCRCDIETPMCLPENAIIRLARKLNLEVTDALTEHWEFALYGMCSVTRTVGDYLDNAVAALDPVFYPIHTNIDRLIVSWRLRFPDRPWNETGFTFPSLDPRVYPDFGSMTNILEAGRVHPGVVWPGNGNPSGACAGHGLYDEIADGSFMNVFRSLPADQPHTNLDVLETIDMELAHPHSADYIYDRYELQES